MKNVARHNANQAAAQHEREKSYYYTVYHIHLEMMKKGSRIKIDVEKRG